MAPRKLTPVLSRTGLCLLGFVCFSTQVIASESKDFTLNAGDHNRRGCPVRFEIPASLRAAPFLRLLDLETTKTVPIQRLGEREAVFVAGGLMGANTQRRFRLSPAPEPESEQATVRCVMNRGVAIFRVGGRPVLAFNVEDVEPPDGLGREFRRSGHIHPVWTPAGRAVTDDFVPADEHKHGIFTAWVNANFQGRNIDFWNQWKGLGTGTGLRGIIRDRTG